MSLEVDEFGEAELLTSEVELLTSEVNHKEDMGSSDKEDRGSSDEVTELVDGVVDPAIMKIGPEIVPSKEVVSDKHVAPVEVVTSETFVSEARTILIEELGRGQRVKTPSVNLTDNVTYNTVYRQNSIPHVLSYIVFVNPVPGNTLYPLTEYISDERFSAEHKAFLTSACAESEPKNFKEAMLDERWNKSVYKEIIALEVAKTWSVVDLPRGRVALGTMWVFKIKYNADGTVERLKSRLMVLGNRQKEGCDYDETFAPVAKMTIIRSLLKIVAANNWEVHQIDVHNAFLHGDLREEVYIKLPQGIENPDPRKVCRLHKSLYGLKEAP